MAVMWSEHPPHTALVVRDLDRTRRTADIHFFLISRNTGGLMNVKTTTSSPVVVLMS
jgi:hypothetical protein